MSTIIIACRTIADELNLAIKETGCKHPVLWMDAGLHANPDILKKKLQEELDRIDNVDQIILAYGYCGNALIGLKANNFSLVFPRADDCISLVLGSCKKRQEVSKEMATYFLTKGWLDSDKNMWTEHQETIKRYGKERADRIANALYRNYKRLGVIETGAYKVNDILEQTQLIADELKLQHQILPGTIEYLKKLLTGPWDDQFFIINKGGTVTMGLIYSDNSASTNPQ
jgi:hypothetical protein